MVQYFKVPPSTPAKLLSMAKTAIILRGSVVSGKVVNVKSATFGVGPIGGTKKSVPFVPIVIVL